jgi:hypothetical protein
LLQRGSGKSGSVVNPAGCRTAYDPGHGSPLATGDEFDLHRAHTQMPVSTPLDAEPETGSLVTPLFDEWTSNRSIPFLGTKSIPNW